jgi:hypothetical protein
MQESIVKSAASSGASAVGGLVVAAVAQMLFYPERYSAESVKRLDALKAAYREFYGEDPPIIWSLSEDKSPYQMLPEGTNWESYVSSRIRHSKTTDLTVIVKKTLKVISDFLDRRRLDIGMMHGIQRGDIEELFFGEMMNWLIDVLNSDIDEMLGEKIEKRRLYLDSVFGNASIFKSQIFHDQSPSRKVIDDINNLIEKSTKETQRFTLTKFLDIKREAVALNYHFLTGFSYFSETLKEVTDLEDVKFLKKFKKKAGPYTQLFLLFVEKYASHIENDAEEFDPLREFSALLGGEYKKTDIWVDITEGMQKKIPDIFASAYNMLIVLRLISKASMVISQEGTTKLFCDALSREYFLFLIEDFKSELNDFIKKLTLFNEEYRKYSKAEILRTKKNPIKENSAGQYLRFGQNFEFIKQYEINLQAYLASAAKGIKEFNGRPEDSCKLRDELYSSLRKRMHKKGASEMAENLERNSKLMYAHGGVADRKDEEAEAREVQGVASQSRHAQDAGERSMHGLPVMVVEEEKKDNVPNDGSVLRETEAYKLLVVEQTAFLRQKIKTSLGSLVSYEKAFFRWLRSSENIGLSSTLHQIFVCAISEMPDIGVYETELSVFYDRLGTFIEQLQDEDSTNKYKLKARISESIYCIARGLKDIFDKEKYKHLFSGEESEKKKNVQLTSALGEERKLLTNLRDQVAKKDEELLNFQSKSKMYEDRMEMQDKVIKDLKQSFRKKMAKMLEVMDKEIEERVEEIVRNKEKDGEQSPAPKPVPAPRSIVDEEESSSVYAR